MTAFNKKICYKRHKDQKKKIEYNHVHNILRIFLSKFSLHQKRNEVSLLVKKLLYTSCLKSCKTSSELASYEIRKYQKNLDT